MTAALYALIAAALGVGLIVAGVAMLAGAAWALIAAGVAVVAGAVLLYPTDSSRK